MVYVCSSLDDYQLIDRRRLRGGAWVGAVEQPA